MNQKSGIEIVIDTSALDKVANKADAADRALDNIANSVDDLERALAGIGAVDVRVNVDDTEVVTARGDIAGLGDLTPDAKVSIDDTEVVTAAGDVAEIGSLAPEAKVNVDDTEVVTAKGDVTAIGSLSPDVKITTDISDPNKDLATIKNQLETLKTLSVIDIAMNMPGNVGKLFEAIPGFNAIVELDNAVRTLGITTTDTIEDAEGLISGIYVQGFGESREEIGRMIGTLSNLGIAQDDLGDVATTLFETQRAIAGITGEAPGTEDLLKRMQSLQELGLAEDFENAGDIITAGFQSAIGISGDFMGDLGEFAPTFATLGFTAEQMLNTLDTGLAGGVDNISRMSEGLISFNEAATQAPDNVRQTLAELDRVSGTDLMGELDIFQAGQTTGADFMASVLDSARAYADTEGLPAVQGILGNLFGGTASNIGAQALLNIDPNADEFSELEGRAQAASDEMQKSFENMFTEIERLADDAARRFFSSDAIDLDGKLATLRGQLDTFLSELESGNTASGSLEVAFNLEDGSIGRIESLFNNIAISFMQAMQGVLSILGKSSEAEALGEEIARIAGGQLQFDLGVVEPDKLVDSITTAVSRTGDWTPVITAVQGAMDEAMAAGDFGKGFDIVGAARDALAAEGQHPELDLVFEQMGVRMADSLRPAFDEAMNTGNLVDAQAIAEGIGDIDMMLAAEEMAAQLKASFDSAMATEDFDTAALIAEQIGDPALIQQVADLGGAITATADATVAAGTATSGALAETAKAVEDYSGRSETELAANVDVWANWEAPVVKTIANVDTKVTNLTSKIGSLSTALGGLGEAAVPEEPSATPHASGGTAYGRSLVGEEGPEVVDFPNRAGIINAANSSVLMRAIDSFAASRGVGGGGSTTNIYLNSTMNAQSVSQADAFGYRLSRQVRGFSS